MDPLNYKYLYETIPFEQNGKTLLSIGFHITFYFGDCDTTETRQAVATLCDEYQALCGKHLKWQTHPTTYNWKKIKPEYSPDIWILENPKNLRVWQVIMHGGRTCDESSPYRMRTLGFPEPNQMLSYFSVCFPFDWFVDPDKEDPISLVTRWAEILKPWHGSAGMTVISSLDRTQERSSAKHVYALMQRFPGLEYNDPTSHRGYLNNKIKSVNWLTIIQNSQITQLGGKDTIKQALAHDTAIHSYFYDGGMVIQAGPHPDIGDVNMQLTPKHYKAVNQVLKSIRVGKEHPRFMSFPDNTTQEWLARFD